MNVGTVVIAHGNTPTVQDTLESVHTWVGNQVVVIGDGEQKEWLEGADLAAHKLLGFPHNHSVGSYRNQVFGLDFLTSHVEADWYILAEYDVLFGNSDFKRDLEDATERGVWMLGADCRTRNFRFPLLEKMIGKEFDCSKYVLGCCQIFHKDFITKLREINFFERFLNLTNDFQKGFFPDFDNQGGYDFGEHLFATLCHQLGGTIEPLSEWDQLALQWNGRYQRYPIRWTPELDPNTENFLDASIIHPLKNWDHPIRYFHKMKRLGLNAK